MRRSSSLRLNMQSGGLRPPHPPNPLTTPTPPASWGDEMGHRGINILQFCNASVRLTPDTLNGVNNESDDPRVREIEETR